MISQATFHGKSAHQTSASNFSAFAGYRVYLFTASVGSLVFTIPTARAFCMGGTMLKQWPSFIVANVGSNAFQVNDRAGGTIVASLTAGQWLFLVCTNNTTQAGSWIQHIRTRLT